MTAARCCPPRPSPPRATTKDGKCTVCGAADPDYRPEQPEDPGQPEKPEQPANPGVKTGDSGVLLYMGLMLLALTGSAWVLRKKRAR